MSKPSLSLGRDRGSQLILALALCMFAPAAMLGQSADTNTGEIAIFGGGGFGMGTHPVVGGSSGIAFSRYGVALIEAAFMPLGRETVRRREGPVQDSRLFDFNGSFHIRIPVRDRWAPYAILGGGLLFDSFSTVSTPERGGIAIDEFNFGFHTGAGVRFYIRNGWGIRPEFKVIVSNRTYTRLTVGLFYTTPPDWP